MVAPFGTGAQRRTVQQCRIRETGLGLEDIRAFRRDGVLILRNVLTPAELRVVDEAATALVDWAWETGTHPDVVWTDHPGRPGAVPTRIEYPMDKSGPVLSLAGHPVLLGVVEALVGPNFIPTWDSMVFKVEQGAPGLDWHRDGEMYDRPVAVTGCGRVVDVGIYLDPAPPHNCVWAVPGSNYWNDEKAAETTARLNAHGWCTDGGVPAVMAPGDVLLHNILTLHGAPPTIGSRRRVIYFEYRPAELEYHSGPHDRAYIGLKQKVLHAALNARRHADESQDEDPFVYQPADAMRLWDDTPLTTLRFPHRQFWTWPSFS